MLGAALVLGGCLFGLAGTQVLEVGRTGVWIPVRTGEVVTLRYTQSMYGTPVEERLRVDDGHLVLFEVAASDACLEYLRIETRGPGNAAASLDRFTVPSASVGAHVLTAGGRELRLADAPAEDGRVTVRLTRVPRLMTILQRIKESLT